MSEKRKMYSSSLILLFYAVSGDLKTVAAKAPNQPSSTESFATTPQTIITAAPRSRTRPPRLPSPLGTDRPGLQALNPTGPQWTSWSSWSACSEECRSGESRARTRACRDSETWSTLPDIQPCLDRGGANVEIRPCPCLLQRNQRNNGQLKGERRKSYY